MYNRYISNDHGNYAPIPEEPPCRFPQEPDPSAKAPDDRKSPRRHSLDNIKEFWNTLTDRLHLDAGDLLLLALLYFLYREDADEELLIALGLLLIL